MNLKSILIFGLSIFFISMATGVNAESLECFDYPNYRNGLTRLGWYNPTGFGTIGDYVLFENNGNQLVILDASDPLNPITAFESYLYFYENNYFIDGSYVLRGVGNYLRLYDASDPMDFQKVYYGPMEDILGLRFYPAIFRIEGGLFSIAATNNNKKAVFIYELGQYGGPASIIRIESHIRSLALTEKRLFVGLDDGIRVYGLSDPGDPQFLELIDLPGSMDLYVDDSFLYVTCGGFLHVIDLHTPDNYQVIASLQVGYNSNEIDVNGALAYISDAFCGVHIVDISRRSLPVYRKTLIIPNGCDGLVEMGSILYLADADVGLRVFDSSENVIPRHYMYSMTGKDLTKEGNLVFGTTTDKYRIMDFSNPSAPVSLGEVPMSSQEPKFHCEGSGMALLNDPGENETFVLDISDPRDPTICCSLNVPGVPDCGIIIGDYAFYDDPAGQNILIIDLEDRWNPIVVGEIPMTNDVRCMAQFEDYLVLGTYYLNGLQVFDISTPESPQFLGSLELEGAPEKIIVRDDLLYCFYNWHPVASFCVVNLEDPTNPSLMTEILVGGVGKDLDVVGPTAYLATLSGIQIIDLSTPEDPDRLGTYGGSSSSLVAIEDGIIGSYGSGLFGAPLQCDSTTPVFLSRFDVDQNSSVAKIRWQVSEDADLEYSESGQGWARLADRSLTTAGGNSELALKAEPNPFNAQISLGFFLNRPQVIQLDIFGIDGRRILELENQRLGSGKHDYVWNGCDQGGSQVSSGTYFIRLATEEAIQTRPISLVK